MSAGRPAAVITGKDAASVAEALAGNLLGVSKDAANFRGLPDSFWGYFARGHDGNGAFGVFVVYSEDGADIDSLIGQYEKWAASRGGAAGGSVAAEAAEAAATPPAAALPDCPR